MLLQIRDFIRQHKVVSSQQVSREFCIDSQALQPMLDIWLNRGVIARCDDKASCQSRCFKCKQPPVYYRYLADC